MLTHRKILKHLEGALKARKGLYFNDSKKSPEEISSPNPLLEPKRFTYVETPDEGPPIAHYPFLAVHEKDHTKALNTDGWCRFGPDDDRISARGHVKDVPAIQVHASIAADELRETLLKLVPPSECEFPHKGLVLSGLRVIGHLDLHRLDLPFSIRFRHCVLAEGITLNWAKLRTFDLSNCIVGRVNATYATFFGNVRWNASLFTSAVDFGGSTFKGVLDLRRSYILPGTSHYFALVAEHQPNPGDIEKAQNETYTPSPAVEEEWLKTYWKDRNDNEVGKSGPDRATINRIVLQRDDPKHDAFIDDRNALNLSLCTCERELRLSEMVIIGGVSVINIIVDTSVFVNRSCFISCIEGSRLLSTPSQFSKQPNAVDAVFEGIEQGDYYEFGRPPIADALREKIRAPNTPPTANPFEQAAQKHLRVLHLLLTHSAHHAEAYGLGSFDEAKPKKTLSRMSISALRGAGARISHAFYLRDTYLLGSLRMKRLVVGDIFDASGCVIAAPIGNLRLGSLAADTVEMQRTGDGLSEPDVRNVPTPAIYLDDLKAGELKFANAHVTGSIRLTAATIDSNLIFSGMIWRPAPLLKPDDCDAKADRNVTIRRPLLLARGLCIGGDFEWGRHTRSHDDNNPELRLLRPANRTSTDKDDETLSKKGLEQKSSWRFEPSTTTELEFDQKERFIIDIIGAKISGDLDFVTLTAANNDLTTSPPPPIEKPWPVSLQGQSMQVGRRLSVRPFRQLDSNSIPTPTDTDAKAPMRYLAVGTELTDWLPKSSALLQERSELTWSGAPNATFSFANTSASEFEHGNDAWPKPRRLEIEGLRYRTLGRYGPLEVNAYVNGIDDLRNQIIGSFFGLLIPAALMSWWFVKSYGAESDYSISLELHVAAWLTIFSSAPLVGGLASKAKDISRSVLVKSPISNFVAPKSSQRLLGAKNPVTILDYLELQADVRQHTPDDTKAKLDGKAIPIQPFAQAARALRSMGLHRGSRLVSQQRIRVQNRGNPILEATGLFLDALMGLGYDAMRLINILIVVLSLGWLSMEYMKSYDQIVPRTDFLYADDDLIAQPQNSAKDYVAPSATRTSNVAELNTFLLAADRLFPLIDIDVEERFQVCPPPTQSKTNTSVLAPVDLMGCKPPPLLIHPDSKDGDKDQNTADKGCTKKPTKEARDIKRWIHSAGYLWFSYAPLLGWLLVTTLFGMGAARLQSTLGRSED